MVVAATMSAAAVAPATAAAAMAGLLVALETAAAMVPAAAATAEVMLGLGIETGPACKTAMEAIERRLPETALRSKTSEVLAAAKTAAPKITTMCKGANAAMREEITA